MPTIHNPTNFRPEDYRVIDYIDNQKPKYYFGLPMEQYQHEVHAWESRMTTLFGANWTNGDPNVHRCCHCGNVIVRYIVCCEHIPTSTRVVFGDVCVERLNFADHRQFAADFIRSKANVRARAEKLAAAIETFLNAYPDLKYLYLNRFDVRYERNGFIQNVFSQLMRYGKLSPRQVSAVVESGARDRERSSLIERRRQTAGPAPQGRVRITARVLTVKSYPTAIGGITWKFLLELENQSRVFCSIPRMLLLSVTLPSELRGRTVTIIATWLPKQDDHSFAFGRMPVWVNSEDQTTPAVRQPITPAEAVIQSNRQPITPATPAITPAVNRVRVNPDDWTSEEI